jgi:hypothetical protein
MVLASQFGRQEWKVESIPLESRFLWRVDSFGESIPLKSRCLWLYHLAYYSYCTGKLEVDTVKVLEESLISLGQRLQQ